MIRAAGCMIMDTAGLVLFVKRGPGGDYPGMWAFPGGRIEDGEKPIDAAIRETQEEAAYTVSADKLVEWTRRIANRESTGAQPTPANVGDAIASAAGAPGLTDLASVVPEGGAIVLGGEPVEFTTFITKGVEPFTPVLGPEGAPEHVAFAWAPPDQPPEPLHPGCRVALDRLAMDELGVARAMAAGELASPQFYANVALFDLRITGTGAAYRTSIGEFVWREPSIYLNPEFLARCNGLPVIMEHPKGDTLDSQEFADRVIGTTMLPYIKGDEVWGIAKIYDISAVEMMVTEQLSTSPAVVWRNADNSSVQLETGETFLIEGKPSLLDHVAICRQGVWDKGGNPTGVATTIVRGDQDMVEKTDTTTAADAAPGVAEAVATALKGFGEAFMTKLDGVLARVDSMEKKVDADAAARKDADEKEAEEKKADARKRADSFGFSKRKDGEDDKAYCERHDSEEGDLKKLLEEAGEAEDKAADKSKKSRKDAEDAEDKDRKAADASVAAADGLATKDDLQQLRLDLQNATKARSVSDADYAAMTGAQARADSVYSLFGKSAPRPMDGETLLNYRRRLAVDLKPHSQVWKDVDLGVVAVDEAAFKIAEDMIYEHAGALARSPASVPVGTLRAIPRVTEGGHRETTFSGSPSAWMGRFSNPARRYVTAINQPK